MLENALVLWSSRNNTKKYVGPIHAGSSHDLMQSYRVGNTPGKLLREEIIHPSKPVSWERIQYRPATTPTRQRNSNQLWEAH